MDINDNSRLVILTGAGISAESGIQTFRSDTGLWENHRVNDVATPAGFRRNPQLVQQFYNKRRKAVLAAEPNSAHYAIAKLQEHLKDRCFLVTQNIDDLHERAGSEQVCHIHGEVFKVRCTKDDSHIFKWKTDITESDRCPTCGGALRPHIVWFHEDPFEMELIDQKLETCTHFFSIGTSGNVYPAAGFPSIAKSYGAKLYHFNMVREPEYEWDKQFIGPAGMTVPEVVDGILG